MADLIRIYDRWFFGAISIVGTKLKTIVWFHLTFHEERAAAAASSKFEVIFLFSIFGYSLDWLIRVEVIRKNDISAQSKSHSHFSLNFSVLVPDAVHL